MRHILNTLAGVALAVGLLAVTETAHAHSGFYARTGLGLGYYSMSVDLPGGLGDQSIGGLMIPMEILLGGSIIPGLVVGGGLSLDYAPSPSASSNGVDAELDISQFLLAIGPFVDWYPDPNGGLHAQARVGWGGIETSTEAGGVGGSDPTGLILTLGGGYDHWLSDTLGIGVLGRFTYAPISLNDISYPTIAFNVLASLTYY